MSDTLIFYVYAGDASSVSHSSASILRQTYNTQNPKLYHLSPSPSVAVPVPVHVSPFYQKLGEPSVISPATQSAPLTIIPATSPKSSPSKNKLTLSGKLRQFFTNTGK
eukprot:TRINITY_DN24970_c0_g1_i1.p1 TRINITY_DN24970_c0_g1~~TRINITY_DN24970_c0_g1_i1.p1  ORF type:complete len:108 (-),score=12.60 TRINITY_DN24970_c0_g1_i1:24-347(-)